MEIYKESKFIFQIETNRKIIKTPFFFPSISSIKSTFNIEECLELIIKLGYSGFLISSYDLYKTDGEARGKLLNYISEITEMDVITLLDSGYYEAYWYHDEKWNFKKFEKILEKILVDLCFSFDIFWMDERKVTSHINETITSIAKTASIQKVGSTIPIIHSNPSLFPEVVRKIVEIINPEIIAIPERELGSSIYERAITIKNIRKKLNQTKDSIPLHILGTSSPISILIYTLSGADLYDAIEWSQTVVDPNTGHLLHFSQRDLINCDCDACKMKNISYDAKSLAHNLIFYKNFTEKIRISIKNNKIDGLLNRYLGSNNSRKFRKIVGLR